MPGNGEKSAENAVKSGFDLLEQHSQVSVPTWGEVAEARGSSKAQRLKQLRAYFWRLWPRARPLRRIVVVGCV